MVFTSQTYGRTQGQSGIEVSTLTTPGTIQNTFIGTVGMMGIIKRGPTDVWVPCSSINDYFNVFGVPGDRYWGIYSDLLSQLPDAVDDFYALAGSDAQLWLMRIGGDNKGKAATLSSKNRFGTKTLSLEAGSVGRWAGYDYESQFEAIVVSTQRTITLVLPGIEKNELKGGNIVFSSETGKTFPIIANSSADPNSGEVVFTISPQYDLLAEGVSGPATLSGLATYNREITLTGTVTIPELEDLTGTATISLENSIVVIGNGTNFTTKLKVGDAVYYLNESRTITSITSDTTLTIASPFAGPAGSGLTLQKANLTVVGDGTAFTTELSVGDKLITDFEGVTYERTVAAIADDTNLTLESGFPFGISAASQIKTKNYWVEGDLSADYGNELVPGNYIIDPGRGGQSLKVTEVDASASPERFKVEAQFETDFSNAQITKQNQLAKVILKAPVGEGLFVEYSPGRDYPLTHFRMKVYINGVLVMEAPDCSLDPEDTRGLFVNNVLADLGQNFAYTGPNNTSYYNWLNPSVNEFVGEYTTAPSDDVRPWNGSGEILHLTETSLYTVADFDYQAVINNWVYPNIYDNPLKRFRVNKAAAPMELQGTLSSIGADVTGTATNFLTSLKKGDFLYDPNTNSVRKITQILSDTSLTLEKAFDTNIPADTKAKKAGWIRIDQGLNFLSDTQIGTWFIVSYPESLKGGSDEDFSSINPFWFTKHANIDQDPIQTASRGKGTGPWMWCAPGISDLTIQRLLAAYSSQTIHIFKPEIPGDIIDASEAIRFVQQELGIDRNREPHFPSYAYYRNFTGGGQKFRTIIGELLGREVRMLNSSPDRSFHRATSGMEATLPILEELPINLTPQQEGLLNQAGIRQIVRKGRSGVPVIWGVTHATPDESYAFITTNRLQLSQIHDILESPELLSLMFRPNDLSIANQVRSIMRAYADEKYRIGAYNNFLSRDSAYSLRMVNLENAIANITSQDIRTRLTQIFQDSVIGFELTYVDTPPVDKIDIKLGSMRKTIFASGNGVVAI